LSKIPQAMTQALLDQGLRHIAFAAAQLDPRSLQRLDGYRRALQAAGLAAELPTAALGWLNLDSAVGRGGVGCDAVRWQGVPTQWALAHQEKQRSQRAVARRNRLRSALTQMVMTCGQSKLNRNAASEAVGSGQLPNLG
jgi:LacI family gluconate utilization system Gnt-I transcriptional repressor